MKAVEQFEYRGFHWTLMEDDDGHRLVQTMDRRLSPELGFYQVLGRVVYFTKEAAADRILEMYEEWAKRTKRYQRDEESKAMAEGAPRGGEDEVE